METTGTVINGDHSSTVTVTEDNGAGTTQIGKTVTTTSADGLSVTTQSYLDAAGSPDSKTTDVTVKNGDGSATETTTAFAGTSLMQTGKTISTISADRLTSTTSHYLDGNASPDRVESMVTSTDGAKTDTISTYSPNGATLLFKTIASTSADGLTVTTTTDANGDGVTDSTNIDATVLNTDGTSVETATSYAGSGTAAANEVGQVVTTTSANGLSVTTQTDADGDGTFDAKSTDVTVLNSDGSRTETNTDFNGAGSTQIGKTVVATSGTGLSQTTSTYLDADVTADHVTTDVTALNSDGSTTETITDKSESGATTRKTVVVTSGNGLAVTTSTDLDGNGVNDVVEAVTTNTDRSQSDVTLVYNSAGTLTSKFTKTRSANRLSVSTTDDLDGNGTIDKSSTDAIVVNSDGSRTETLSDFKSGGALNDKTVISTSADGLSVTRQWDDTGNGSYSRSATDVTTINADGSTTEVVSNLNAGGSLHDKTTDVITADGLTNTITKDINGDGTTRPDHRPHRQCRRLDADVEHGRRRALGLRAQLWWHGRPLRDRQRLRPFQDHPVRQERRRPGRQPDHRHDRAQQRRLAR